MKSVNFTERKKIAVDVFETIDMGVQILSFSYRFRQKNLVSTPTLGVGAPLRKILDPPLETFML